jgi:hypothetical protein
VILTKAEEIEAWLTVPVNEALALQRPLPDDALRIVDRGKKENGPDGIEDGEWRESTQVGRRAAALPIVEADIHARRAPARMAPKHCRLAVPRGDSEGKFMQRPRSPDASILGSARSAPANSAVVTASVGRRDRVRRDPARSVSSGTPALRIPS